MSDQVAPASNSAHVPDAPSPLGDYLTTAQTKQAERTEAARLETVRRTKYDNAENAIRGFCDSVQIFADELGSERGTGDAVGIIIQRVHDVRNTLCKLPVPVEVFTGAVAPAGRNLDSEFAVAKFLLETANDIEIEGFFCGFANTEGGWRSFDTLRYVLATLLLDWWADVCLPRFAGCETRADPAAAPLDGTKMRAGENPSADTSPGWADLGDAKRAIMTVLKRSAERLQGRGIAEKAGYKYGSLRHHFGELQTWGYIDKTKEGYAMTQTGAALIPV